MTQPYEVSDFVANSDCRGQAIYLTWDNPTTPGTVENVLIVRRPKQWPFDLTDAGYSVVYNGPIIDTFWDSGISLPTTYSTVASVAMSNLLTVQVVTGYTIGQQVRIEVLTGQSLFEVATIAGINGSTLAFQQPLKNVYPVGARVSLSTPLAPQTYYYYLVLVSQSALPPLSSYNIGTNSQAFALSINAAYNGAYWFQQNTPTNDLKNDAIPQSQGGGGGFLANWFQIMGCWLNLMHGYANAIQLLNDPDQAPFNALPALNVALGIQPEGYSYDYDIVRQTLPSLVPIYHELGTCPGIVATVYMFTKWTATCLSFGDANCYAGETVLATWDGTSVAEVGGPSTAITQHVTSATGTATFTDPAATWTTHLFQGGDLRGWIGDYIDCVTDNTATTLTMTAPPLITTLATAASAGATSLSVESTAELHQYLTIQITDTVVTGLYFNAEIVEIDSVTAGAPGTISITGPGLTNSYHVGAQISIGKSIVRAEYLGSTTTTAAGQVLHDPTAFFCDYQWVGYVLLDSANVLHNVVTNTGNTTITVDGAAPAAGEYSIAKGMTVGGSFAARQPQLEYKVTNGIHSFIWEPTFDLAMRGSIYDPSSRLWAGSGLNLYGVWGPGDVGVYIEGNIPLTFGQASTLSGGGTVFNLDPTTPAPAANSLVGDWLNPNQNQTQMFEIISNTTTTITVGTNIQSLTVSGQYYVVLAPRDKNRFQRVSARLQEEFVDTDVKVHVLFV